MGIIRGESKFRQRVNSLSPLPTSIQPRYAKEVVNLILGLRGIFIKLGQQGAMVSFVD